MYVKAKDIHLYFQENLAEKYYNFSMKMNSKDIEFHSEHSSNYENIMVAPSLHEEEAVPSEDYNHYLDEHKIIK